MKYVVYSESGLRSVKYSCDSEKQAKALCAYLNKKVFPGELIRDRFYCHELIPLKSLLSQLNIKSVPKV